MSAVVFFDWTYSIHRLYPYNKWLLVSDNDIHEYDIDISGAKDVKLYIYSAPPLMETTWVGFADFYFYNKDKFDPTADKSE